MSRVGAHLESDLQLTMSQSKDKSVVTNKGSKAEKVSKAAWEADIVKAFINACYDAVTDGHRTGTCFNNKGWMQVIQQFSRTTRRDYTKGQLKGKWESLKKEWQLWIKIKKDTGVGWDGDTIVMDDDWWKLKYEKNATYKKFKKGGLEHKSELDYIFLGTSATGDHAFVPGARMQPVMSTPMSDMDVSNGESSGDSQDPNYGNIGIENVTSPPMNKKDNHNRSTGKHDLFPPSSAQPKKKSAASSRVDMAKSLSVIAGSLGSPLEYSSSSQALDSCPTVGDILDILHVELDATFDDHFFEWCSIYFFDKAPRLHFRDLRKVEYQKMWIKKFYNDVLLHAYGAELRQQ